MPEAATAGSSSPGMCVYRGCPGLTLPFYVWLVLGYIFRVWSGFRQVACAIGGVTHGARFALNWIDEGAATVNHIAQSVAVIDLRS